MTGLRRAALTVHVVSSVGWLGAVAAFLALAVTGIASDEPELARGAYMAMDVLAWFVVLPLALVSLTSGIVQGLISPWGLFRHYWVVVKLVVTAIATVVLLLQLEPIGTVADIASESALGPVEHGDARVSLLVHAAGGLAVLLIPAVLSIYKPAGRTRYGQRKQQH